MKTRKVLYRVDGKELTPKQWKAHLSARFKKAFKKTFNPARKADCGCEKDVFACGPHALPQHTPTPWTYENHEIWGASKNIAEIHESKSIFSAGEAQANAAFIVRAVNSHEDLLKAAKMALSCMSPDDNDITAQSLRNAIAKAEGK